jgi:thioredoxin-like negative regulator of GroEL
VAQDLYWFGQILTIMLQASQIKPYNLADHLSGLSASKENAAIVFMAEWSGASHMMINTFREIERRFSGSINFYMIDDIQLSDINHILRINSLPGIVLIREGRIVEVISGLQSKDVIAHYFNKTFNKP